MASYSTVQDFRQRLGSCGSDYNDPTLQLVLDGATAFIDSVTGWFFEARSFVMLVDGRGSHILQLPLPIIRITRVEFVDITYEPAASEVDLASLAIYNRHLSGLTNPDDRKNPKISWVVGREPGQRKMFQQSEWTEGEQNIQLTGTWGFTEYVPNASPRSIASDAADAITAPNAIKMTNGTFTQEDVGKTITIAGSASNDGDYVVATVVDSENITVEEQTLTTEGSGFTASMSADPQWGITPVLIKDVCERLAMRDLPSAAGAAIGAGLSDPIEYESRMREQGRVIREKVRDQEIGYAPISASGDGNSAGIITGDPFIDMVLLMHMKPADMSWV